MSYPPYPEISVNQCENEEWRNVVCASELLDIGSVYQVSSLGRIRPIGSDVLKQTPLKGRGYLVVGLTVSGWNKNFRVHRLVAETFIGSPPAPDSQVNHINGDKGDNRVDNLEWSSPRENTVHAVTTGLITSETRSKLSTTDVLEIKRLRAAGIKRRIVAEQFAVSVHNIKAIDLRKSWKHL